jgi:hypothetical protein
MSAEENKALVRRMLAAVRESWTPDMGGARRPPPYPPSPPAGRKSGLRRVATE